MANWKVLKDGEVINTIVADKAFAVIYAETHGYTVEEMPEPEPQPTPEPTAEERIAELEAQLAESDEAAIALYEAQAAQEAINAEQDEAILGIYEMIGG